MHCTLTRLFGAFLQSNVRGRNFVPFLCEFLPEFKNYCQTPQRLVTKQIWNDFTLEGNEV